MQELVGRRSPRVLLVAQPTTEGVAVCVRDLARAGVRAWLTLTVACPSSGNLPRWALFAGARWVATDLVRPPAPADIARVAEVRALARSADVVHLHSSKAGAVGRLSLASLRGSG